MNKYKVYKFFFWCLLVIGFLLNLEPTVKFLILGQIPELHLSPAWKPSWLYPLFGILSVANLIFLILMIKGKTWAAFALGLNAIPHTFPIYFIAERIIIVPVLYILPSVLIILFFYLSHNNQVSLNNEST